MAQINFASMNCVHNIIKQAQFLWIFYLKVQKHIQKNIENFLLPISIHIFEKLLSKGH